MKTKKYYVVRKGRKKGIFCTREECKQYVLQYPDAQYKSFSSLELAKQAWSMGSEQYRALRSKQEKRSFDELVKQNVIAKKSICVDASCKGNPGSLERRCVTMRDKKEVFRSCVYPLGTTNVGEWLAIIQGLRRLYQGGKMDWVLYSDSSIAIGWVQKGVLKTTLQYCEQTYKLWKLIEQEKMWRTRNRETLLHCIDIKKRDTSKRGEIPADFGRK